MDTILEQTYGTLQMNPVTLISISLAGIFFVYWHEHDSYIQQKNSSRFEAIRDILLEQTQQLKRICGEK
jgi:hypothetical protein